MLTPLLASLPLLCPAPAAAPDLELVWRGDAHTEIPEGLPEGARDAVEYWWDWADEWDYRMDLTADGRVLLLLHDKPPYVHETKNERRKRERKGIELPKHVDPTRQRELVAKTCELFDTLLPRPEGRPKGAMCGVNPLEVGTAVLLQMRDAMHYGEAVEHLVKGEPYLEDWKKFAREMNGFVLQRPLVAAWPEGSARLDTNIEANEEWNSDNELVNRLTQLLILRRFGQLPFWLLNGLAWNSEMTIRESIYCFPYRSEFVYETEHRDWAEGLQRKFEWRREKRPLALAEVSDWKRGTYDDPSARISWGAAAFLAKHHAQELPMLLEHLRLVREKKGRVTHEDGTWELIPNFEVSAEDQLKVLREDVHADFLARLEAFFVGGLN